MTTRTNPSVAVVGPGAIGTTIAAAMHEAGRTPLLCGRTARERLELRDAVGHVVVPGPVRIDPTGINEKVELVFLAVKSTQVDAAAPWLTSLCHKDTVICVLQNGVEQDALVAPYASCLLYTSLRFRHAARRVRDSMAWRRKPRARPLSLKILRVQSF